MSMIGNFVAVTPAQLEVFKSDADKLDEFIYPQDPDQAPAHHLDVDKAWSGIHYILTGEPWFGEPPASLVVLGGQEIGNDLGNGPGLYLTPGEVKEAAAYLGSLKFDDLKKSYNPKAMDEADVYPSGIWEDEGEEALDYVLNYLEELIGFYKDAAGRGDGMIKYIN